MVGTIFVFSPCCVPEHWETPEGSLGTHPELQVLHLAAELWVYDPEDGPFDSLTVMASVACVQGPTGSWQKTKWLSPEGAETPAFQYPFERGKLALFTSYYLKIWLLISFSLGDD